MKVYAVIDTNVLVSALLRWDSVPGSIMEHALIGSIIPVLSNEILSEYNEVLRRGKFPFAEEDIVTLIDGLMNRGVALDPTTVSENLPDPTDVIFYAVTMKARQENNAFLITGNIRHFPLKPFIVTPREMLTILENSIKDNISRETV